MCLVFFWTSCPSTLLAVKIDNHWQANTGSTGSWDGGSSFLLAQSEGKSSTWSDWRTFETGGELEWNEQKEFLRISLEKSLVISHDFNHRLWRRQPREEAASILIWRHRRRSDWLVVGSWYCLVQVWVWQMEKSEKGERATHFGTLKLSWQKTSKNPSNSPSGSNLLILFISQWAQGAIDLCSRNGAMKERLSSQSFGHWRTRKAVWF